MRDLSLVSKQRQVVKIYNIVYEVFIGFIRVIVKTDI